MNINNLQMYYKYIVNTIIYKCVTRVLLISELAMQVLPNLGPLIAQGA